MGRVFMPNTYVPMFQLDADDVAAAKIEDTRKRIPEIARHVREGLPAWEVHEGSFPRFKSYVLGMLFIRFVVHSRGFHTDEGCTSCGTCVRLCPMDNVRLADGSPAWGDNCIQLHGMPAWVSVWSYTVREVYPAERALQLVALSSVTFALPYAAVCLVLFILLRYILCFLNLNPYICGVIKPIYFALL